MRADEARNFDVARALLSTRGCSHPREENVREERPNSFSAWYAAMCRHPRRTSALLRGHDRVLALGAGAMCVPLIGYLIVYWGLSRSGAYPSAFTPWLALPAETYYRYNLFLFPIGLGAAWLLSAAVVQVLGHLVNATGRFEETLASLGFAVSLSNWTLLPHDVTVAVLGATGVIDGRAHEHAMNEPTLARTLLWTFAAMYVVAFPVYFTAVLAGVHRLRLREAALLGIVGFIVYQLVFVLFNR